jgi:broad specificity phosphatase PhoE
MARRTSIMLCLIRCGATTWDAAGRVHGSTDLPLSDAGRTAIAAQLHRLGPVKVSIVHHPNDEAAAETARMCAAAIGSAVKTREAPELADPNLGLLEGLTQEEFAERFRSRHKQWRDDPMSLSPPEGEEMPAAAERIFRAVARILHRSRGEEVALVVHDLGWAMLRCWLADRSLEDLRDMADAAGMLIERYALPLDAIDALAEAVAAPPSPA